MNKDKSEEKSKKPAAERLFDTKFIESVRINHADISEIDRSFQPFSEQSLNDSSLLAYSSAANQLKNIIGKQEPRRSNIEDLVDEFI